MGQRVYVLSKDNKWNVLGIYTNIRQVRKSVEILINTDVDIIKKLNLLEIRMNENPRENYGRDVTKLLFDVPNLSTIYEKSEINKN